MAQHSPWWLVAGLALACCPAGAQEPATTQTLTTTLRINDSAFEIDGLINRQVADEFLRLAEKHRPRRLSIASGGGEVIASLDMADYLHAQQMDVEVRSACLSSCANYIFTASRNKTIVAGAVVGWHGTPTHLLHLNDTGAKAVPAEALNFAEQMSERERAFFQRVGVDGFMAWFGKLPPYNVYDTYVLSVDDMARFGVHNVTAADDYPGADLSAWNVDGVQRVVRVHVDWSTLNYDRPSRAGARNAEREAGPPAQE